MTGVRKALIVATDEYGDPKLTRLNAPAQDARALAEVLQDSSVGVFEVQTVLNQNCHDVEVAIATFFASGSRGDTLLVHFSCHGVKDLSGELYFATKDTRLPLLKVTAVSSALVKDAMETSRASLILCLVDCCYSGAFTKSTKAAATVDLTERLGGHGRAVITASTSLQLALDGEEKPSLFTHAVVEGLRSGDADRDLDGLVSLDELYSYVHDRVTAQNPDQTPVKSFDVQGDVYVARRGGPITTPAPLPKELVETFDTGEDWQRLGAVSKLADYLRGDHPGRALAARRQLERVRDLDDSLKVRAAATSELQAAGEVDRMPDIPVYVEGGEESSGGRVGSDGTEVRTTRTIRERVGSWVSFLGGHGARVLQGSVVVALTVLAVLWFVLSRDDDGGGGDGGDGTVDESETLPRLADTELLVPVLTPEGRQLLVVDVESGSQRELLAGVDLPTLDHERGSMSYVRVVEAGGHRGRVAYTAGVDLRRERPVLAPAARAGCPSSSRPAVSLDGGSLAFVCRDETGTASGLWVLDTQDDLTPWVQDSRVSEAPTWTGNGELVFVLGDNGPAGQSTLMQVSAPGAEPEQLTEGTAGWDSHPDWSDSGVLFLRSPGEDRIGDVYLLEDRAVTRLTSRGDVESPTWSPDGSQIAYVARNASGGRSLWIQDAEPGAEPVEIPVDGDPGAPAWGAR